MLRVPGFVSVLSSNILAPLSLFVLAISLAFCWYQWKHVRAYRHFPSARIDTKWLLQILLGNYPKHVPITSGLATFVNTVFGLWRQNKKVIFQKFAEAVKKFQAEGLCVVWLLRPYVFIHGEEFVKHLVNDTSLGNKATAFYGTNKLLLGNGLITSNHELWKTQRKLLNPAFTVGVLKGNVHIFNKYGRKLADKLQTVVDKPFDDIIKQYSFNIMAESVLGLQLNDERQEFIAENCMKTIDVGTEYTIERVSRPWLYWDFLLPFSQFGRKYIRVANEANRLLRQIIEELLKIADVWRKEEHDAEVKVNKSSGSILIKRHLQDPSFTLKEVRDQILTLTVAGYDSASSSLMWCFYMLGHHPQVQEKAYNEIESVVPEGELTYDHLFELKYLECVIKETMRLYSPVPIYARKASKEIQCGQYTIPKGTDVVFFTFMLHRNPNIYPQPEKFDPERFADGSKIRPWMFVPFAEGYRSCPGKRYAMMETKILLAHVLRRYKITSLNHIDESELDWNIVLKSTKPPRMLFQIRQPQS